MEIKPLCNMMFLGLKCIPYLINYGLTAILGNWVFPSLNRKRTAILLHNLKKYFFLSLWKGNSLPLLVLHGFFQLSDILLTADQEQLTALCSPQRNQGILNNSCTRWQFLKNSWSWTADSFVSFLPLKNSILQTFRSSDFAKKNLLQMRGDVYNFANT